jgi:hypothetical protein
MMPSEFLVRATPLDLAILQQYDAKFLLGDLHADFNTAHHLATYVNTKLKPGATPVQITDFMPLLPAEAKAREPQDPKVMKAMFLAAFAPQIARSKSPAPPR